MTSTEAFLIVDCIKAAGVWALVFLCFQVLKEIVGQGP